MRNVIRSIVFLFGFAAVLVGLATVALAADALPWEGLEINIGGVVLVWAGIQTALVQILKSIKVDGRSFLPTKWSKRLANVALGFVGLILAAASTGTPLGEALWAAIGATLGAVGLWEYLGDAIGGEEKKDSEPRNPTGTESTESGAT